MSRPLALAAIHSAWRRIGPYVLRRVLKVVPRNDLVTLGQSGASWTVPETFLAKGAICYCGGVGEDISFDTELVRTYGCVVFAFDPTPKAIAHVAANASNLPSFHFMPVGLWSEEATLKFYEPRNPEHVSHSVKNLQDTEAFFTADCKPVSAIMKSKGHKRIDLIKLDIEGAEYEVLAEMLASRVTPRVLCVEFDQPTSPLITLKMIGRIRDEGYCLVAVKSWNYTFVLETPN